MEHVTSPAGVKVSFERYGSGPPLVLVHGSFSTHESNWMFVRPLLEPDFTMIAVARRGRGETTATRGHSVMDEARDVALVLEALGEPAFLLGHSYGAHCAVEAAAMRPRSVRKLVVYEPVWPHILSAGAMARLEELTAAGEWDAFAVEFFRDTLLVPEAEIEAVRTSGGWPLIVSDAEASLGDLRALAAHAFQPDRFRSLHLPVLLQIGSESPRHLYVTDALAAVLPDARIEALAGQAHEGMTTAPALYADAVTRFLLGGEAA